MLITPPVAAATPPLLMPLFSLRFFRYAMLESERHAAADGMMPCPAPYFFADG